MTSRSQAGRRYLVVSTSNHPDVVEYADTGARLVVLADERLAYPHGAHAQQQPVIAEAMRAAAAGDPLIGPRMQQRADGDMSLRFGR